MQTYKPSQMLREQIKVLNKERPFSPISEHAMDLRQLRNTAIRLAAAKRDQCWFHPGSVSVSIGEIVSAIIQLKSNPESKAVKSKRKKAA